MASQLKDVKDSEEITIENLPPMFDQKVFARAIGKSTAWLERCRWEKSGAPYYKIGGQVRYKRKDVLEYIESRKRGGGK